MNSHDDKAWETRLDKALKGLPELAAPAGLTEKTMARLQQRQKPSLIFQPWPTWPLWLRAVSLVSMLAFVGGICFVKWEFAQSVFGQKVMRSVNDHFSDWSVAMGTLDTLGRAAVAVAHHLNSWVLLLCLVSATVTYFACIGLGTAAVRFAFARR
jgi:hypothetical protein